MSKTMEEILERLNKDLDVSRVSYRKAPGNDGDVPYLEGHDVITQLNDIFGYTWSSSVREVAFHQWERPVTKWNNATRTKDIVKDKDGNIVMEQTGVVYVTVSLWVQIGDQEVHKEDIGVAIITGSTPEAMEMAIKGAATDGLKRAARQLGEQFGNTLYDKEIRAEIKAEIGHQQQPAQRANPPKTNGSAQQAAKPAAPAAVAEKSPLDRAKEYVIPVGKPMGGKTLGEAAADQKFGRSVVNWLAGLQENRQGQKFEPANADEEKLQAAAKYLIEHDK